MRSPPGASTRARPVARATRGRARMLAKIRSKGASRQSAGGRGRPRRNSRSGASRRSAAHSRASPGPPPDRCRWRARGGRWPGRRRWRARPCRSPHRGCWRGVRRFRIRSSARRQPSVVPWWPVPKAVPASISSEMPPARRRTRSCAPCRKKRPAATGASPSSDWRTQSRWGRGAITP